jgi:hypothetical protein
VPARALRDGWEPRVSRTHGDTYYFHPATEETSWEHPGYAPLPNTGSSGGGGGSLGNACCAARAERPGTTTPWDAAATGVAPMPALAPLQQRQSYLAPVSTSAWRSVPPPLAAEAQMGDADTPMVGQPDSGATAAEAARPAVWVVAGRLAVRPVRCTGLGSPGVQGSGGSTQRQRQRQPPQPYVVLRLHDDGPTEQRWRTPTAPRGSDPLFFDCHQLPPLPPARFVVNGRSSSGLPCSLAVEVWDEHKLGKDVLLCSAVLDLAATIAGGGGGGGGGGGSEGLPTAPRHWHQTLPLRSRVPEEPPPPPQWGGQGGRQLQGTIELELALLPIDDDGGDAPAAASPHEMISPPEVVLQRRLVHWLGRRGTQPLQDSWAVAGSSSSGAVGSAVGMAAWEETRRDPTGVAEFRALVANLRAAAAGAAGAGAHGFASSEAFAFVDSDFPPTRASLWGARRSAPPSARGGGSVGGSVGGAVWGAGAAARVAWKRPAEIGERHTRAVVWAGYHHGHGHGAPQSWRSDWGAGGRMLRPGQSEGQEWVAAVWCCLAAEHTRLQAVAAVAAEAAQERVGGSGWAGAERSAGFTVPCPVSNVLLGGGAFGVYGVQLWVEGRWLTVVVDDTIPCELVDGEWRPLWSGLHYATRQASDPPQQQQQRSIGQGGSSWRVKELWPLLLEKAWCKLHGGYAVALGGADEWEAGGGGRLDAGGGLQLRRVSRSEECAAALSGGLTQCYRLPSVTIAPDWVGGEAAAHAVQPAPDTDGAGRRVRQLLTWESVRDLLHHAGAGPCIARTVAGRTAAGAGGGGGGGGGGGRGGEGHHQPLALPGGEPFALLAAVHSSRGQLVQLGAPWAAPGVGGGAPQRAGRWDGRFGDHDDEVWTPAFLRELLGRGQAGAHDDRWTVSRAVHEHAVVQGLADPPFWMSWEDFAANFAEVGVCTHWQADYQSRKPVAATAADDPPQLVHCSSVVGRWEAGRSAGGKAGLRTSRFNPRFRVAVHDADTHLKDTHTARAVHISLFPPAVRTGTTTRRSAGRLPPGWGPSSDDDGGDDDDDETESEDELVSAGGEVYVYRQRSGGVYALGVGVVEATGLLLRSAPGSGSGYPVYAQVELLLFGVVAQTRTTTLAAGGARLRWVGAAAAAAAAAGAAGSMPGDCVRFERLEEGAIHGARVRVSLYEQGGGAHKLLGQTPLLRLDDDEESRLAAGRTRTRMNSLAAEREEDGGSTQERVRWVPLQGGGAARGSGVGAVAAAEERRPLGELCIVLGALEWEAPLLEEIMHCCPAQARVPHPPTPHLPVSGGSAIRQSLRSTTAGPPPTEVDDSSDATAAQTVMLQLAPGEADVILMVAAWQAGVVGDFRLVARSEGQHMGGRTRTGLAEQEREGGARVTVTALPPVPVTDPRDALRMVRRCNRHRHQPDRLGGGGALSCAVCGLAIPAGAARYESELGPCHAGGCHAQALLSAHPPPRGWRADASGRPSGSGAVRYICEASGAVSNLRPRMQIGDVWSTLRVSVLCARGLPKRGRFWHGDHYVTVRLIAQDESRAMADAAGSGAVGDFMQQEYKTNVLHQTAAPAWNQTFDFAADKIGDGSQACIELCVADDHLIRADRELGSARLRLSDVAADGGVVLERWLRLRLTHQQATQQQRRRQPGSSSGKRGRISQQQGQVNEPPAGGRGEVLARFELLRHPPASAGLHEPVHASPHSSDRHHAGLGGGRSEPGAWEQPEQSGGGGAERPYGHHGRGGLRLKGGIEAERQLEAARGRLWAAVRQEMLRRLGGGGGGGVGVDVSRAAVEAELRAMGLLLPEEASAAQRASARRRLIQAGPPLGCDEAEATRRLLGRFDADRCGALTFEQFRRLLYTVGRLNCAATVAAADGAASSSSTKQQRQGGGDRLALEADVLRIFEHVDESGDGEVSAAELARFLQGPPLGLRLQRSARQRAAQRAVLCVHGGSDAWGDDGPGGSAAAAVSRPFPSWNRSILTDIYLCHACSCQAILRAETAGQAAAAAHSMLPQLDDFAVRQLWRSWDWNGSGRLSLAEIQKALLQSPPRAWGRERCAAISKAALQAAYAIADTDYAGFIERNEFPGLLQELSLADALWGHLFGGGAASGADGESGRRRGRRAELHGDAHLSQLDFEAMVTASGATAAHDSDDDDGDGDDNDGNDEGRGSLVLSLVLGEATAAPLSPSEATRMFREMDANQVCGLAKPTPICQRLTLRPRSGQRLLRPVVLKTACWFVARTLLHLAGAQGGEVSFRELLGWSSAHHSGAARRRGLSLGEHLGQLAEQLEAQRQRGERAAQARRRRRRAGRAAETTAHRSSTERGRGRGRRRGRGGVSMMTMGGAAAAAAAAVSSHEAATARLRERDRQQRHSCDSGAGGGGGVSAVLSSSELAGRRRSGSGGRGRATTPTRGQQQQQQQQQRSYTHRSGATPPRSGRGGGGGGSGGGAAAAAALPARYDGALRLLRRALRRGGQPAARALRGALQASAGSSLLSGYGTGGGAGGAGRAAAAAAHHRHHPHHHGGGLTRHEVGIALREEGGLRSLSEAAVDELVEALDNTGDYVAPLSSLRAWCATEAIVPPWCS